MALIITGCATQRGFPARNQINNFSQVDARLYRSAQPPYSSFADLAALGVKSVINLRQPGDELPDEETFVKLAGMTYTNLPMSGVSTPTHDQMNHILATVEALPGPVYVHCQFGCDRTGLVVGCWRIRHDGWTNDKAVEEAKAFGASDLLPNFRHFLATFK